MALKRGNENKKDLIILHRAAYKRKEDNNFIFSNRALLNRPLIKPSRKKNIKNIYQTTRKKLKKTRRTKITKNK